MKDILFRAYTIYEAVFGYAPTHINTEQYTSSSGKETVSMHLRAAGNLGNMNITPDPLDDLQDYIDIRGFRNKDATYYVSAWIPSAGPLPKSFYALREVFK